MFGTSFPLIIRRGGRLYVRLNPVLASVTNLLPLSPACSCPLRDTLTNYYY